MAEGAPAADVHIARELDHALAVAELHDADIADVVRIAKRWQAWLTR